jgi:hypothetical protein
MAPDSEIYRAASLLMEEFGHMAPEYAAMCAEGSLESGDVDGREVWLQILEVVEDFMSGAVPAGVTIH